MQYWGYMKVIMSSHNRNYVVQILPFRHIFPIVTSFELGIVFIEIIILIFHWIINRFLTDIRSKGAKGFRIVWTRVISRLTNGSCPGFQCINSGHCISKNLTCNKVFNCGSYINISGMPSIDTTDEIHACKISYCLYSIHNVSMRLFIVKLFLARLINGFIKYVFI